MGAGKAFLLDPSVAAGGQGDPRRRAQIDLAFRKAGQGVEAMAKSVGLVRYRHYGVCRKGLGVHGGHEDRRRDAVPPGNAGEGPGAQGGPEAAGHQRLHQRAALYPSDGLGADHREGDRTPCFVYVDDHRLESALSAAVNGTDRARGRRRKDHARVLFIFEENLPLLHPVPFLDRHGGFHSDEVGAEDGDLARRPCVFNGWFGGARDGQIETTLKADHALAAAPLLRPTNPVCRWLGPRTRVGIAGSKTAGPFVCFPPLARRSNDRPRTAEAF